MYLNFALKILLLSFICISVIGSGELRILTPEQLAQYEQDGFLVLEGFVNPKACDALRKRALKLVDDFDPSSISEIFTTRHQGKAKDSYFLSSANKICFFFEEEAFLPDGTLRQAKELSINKMGHAMHDLDPIFDFFSRTQKIENLVTDLGLNHPLLMQSMYIFKQPFIGGEVTCHQDGTFLYTEPDSSIGLWIALEDATLLNGCLWAIPGGHVIPLKKRFFKTEDGGTKFETYDTTPWDLTKMVPLEVPKGSLIVLHSRVPHMSYANRSSKSRHAYTLHIIDRSSVYPADNWLQRAEDFPAKGF